MTVISITIQRNFIKLTMSGLSGFGLLMKMVRRAEKVMSSGLLDRLALFAKTLDSVQPQQEKIPSGFDFRELSVNFRTRRLSLQQ